MKYIFKGMLTATVTTAILATGAIAEDTPRNGWYFNYRYGH